jgi:hypothetical protein
MWNDTEFVTNVKYVSIARIYSISLVFNIALKFLFLNIIYQTQQIVADAAIL